MVLYFFRFIYYTFVVTNSSAADCSKIESQPGLANKLNVSTVVVVVTPLGSILAVLGIDGEPPPPPPAHRVEVFWCRCQVMLAFGVAVGELVNEVVRVLA